MHVTYAEIEKALAGGSSSHQGDSGVATRQLGTLLTWLNDHTSNVFVVATSNNASRLPPELSRAGRFDALFFVDLPTKEEQSMIWKIYGERYNLSADQQFGEPFFNATDWTGAEIESCCRLASLLEVPLREAAQQVVPVAQTYPEQVDGLRTWATGRCLSAAQKGIYQKDAVQLSLNGVTKATRSIRRPSKN